jgi:hypothetical protein
MKPANKQSSHRLSAHAGRARTLLLGGLAGGHIAALVCLFIFGVLAGRDGAVSAAIWAAVVLLFFTVGQAVQIMVADADPRVVMVSAVSSYILRVTIIGVLLMLALNNLDIFSFMYPPAVIITVFAVVVGWLAAEFWVFQRLRIPVFDPPTSENG